MTLLSSTAMANCGGLDSARRYFSRTKPTEGSAERRLPVPRVTLNASLASFAPVAKITFAPQLTSSYPKHKISF